MSSAYIIEIGEETAGIVAAEKQGFRFYASLRACDALEGVLFNTPRQAEMAVRAHIRKRNGGSTQPARRGAH